MLNDQELQGLASFFHCSKESILLNQVKYGGNNQSFTAQINNEVFLIKKYFKSNDDSRDRGRTENSFLSLLAQNGITNIPNPIFYDSDLSLGAYSYIDGRHSEESDITWSNVHQCLEFFKDINLLREKADTILPASEACFSISDHITLIGNRINKLNTASNSDSFDSDARTFITNSLIPKWNAQTKYVEQSFSKAELNYKLDKDEMCLSPSDFGFHNILMKYDKPYFLDFEYAGWDDPAKMVCDFFLQAKLPVPREHFSQFLEFVQNLYPKSVNISKRVNILFPIYHIKWCCIVLNPFLPTGLSRRAFAGEVIDETHKKVQLNKAINIFRLMEKL